MDTLPVELRLKIASYACEADVLSMFSLLRTSKAWRGCIQRYSYLLPKYEVSSLRLEQYSYVRFQFKVNVVIVMPDKATVIRNLYFRSLYDLKLFLGVITVRNSLYISLFHDLDIKDSLAVACEEVHDLSIRVVSNSEKETHVTIPHLLNVCNALPNMNSLTLEDASTMWNEDAYELLKSLNRLTFVELRSGNPQSRLGIDDRSLLSVAASTTPWDCVVLSTNTSEFSIEAMRKFLQTVNFTSHGLLELYSVDCTASDFFHLLQELNIQFESEPLRGIYNSFPIILNGVGVCINIKYFNEPDYEE